MRRVVLLAGASLALTSVWAVAQDSPESLLPKMFDEPAPSRSASPRPTPRPTPSHPASRPSASPASSASAAPRTTATSTPVVQPVPTATSAPGAFAAVSPKQPEGTLRRIPSLEELERMSPEDFEALLGTKVLIDMPPGVRRTPDEAGLIDAREGGLPMESLRGQNGALIRVALAGNRGQLVSRWGHILLRRALASRLNPPGGMTAADFVALRVSLLLRMGETDAARAVLQNLDIADYNPAFGALAFDVYARTADFTGLCPVMATQGSLRDDAGWNTSRTICEAFRGNSTAAIARLERDRISGKMDQIDLLLAQKYAGAAGKARRAVTIEWDKVTTMTPWRYGLAIGTGLEPPANLMANAGPSYDFATALAPMASLTRRAAAADRAAAAGVLSSAAMVDLYSQIFADPYVTGEWQERAEALRDAYVQQDAAARLAAMKTLWNVKGPTQYGRQVLTAAAAARMAPSADLADSAPLLIASMLAAGYDANALRWSRVVEAGSRAWGMLVLSAPERVAAVDSGAIDTFVKDDDSAGGRRSTFLAAGLAGLDRLDRETAERIARDAGMNMGGSTRWTDAIEGAASRGDQATVAFLVAFGMQGESWQRMTPRNLFHIVSALRKVGLEAEARMIAAEAVARV